jgi:hypothetical protein
MSPGSRRPGLATAARRSCTPLLVACLVLAGVGTATHARASTSIEADPGSGAHAGTGKRCKRVRVKVKRGGKVVRRNGKPVFRKVRRCKRVPSPGCRFVKVKKRRNGKVVKRRGKPIYIRVERCPPKPKPVPGPQPAPAPGAGPQPGPGPTPGPEPAEALANRVMALDPRVPGDIGLFSSVFQPSGSEGLYPGGSPMAPAGGPVLTEQQVRGQMRPFLNAWYGGDAARVSAALAVFDAAQAKTMVPDPDLRAALASLEGTIWEPQLSYFLTGARFTPARYGGLPNTVHARSALDAVSGKFTIIVNSRYEAEHFARKIPIWVHEIGHDDAPDTHHEERTLHGLNALAWGQVLHASPGYAHANTELTRVMNSYVLRFLNSREKGSPQSEIVAPTGIGTAPGSPYDTPDVATAIAEPAQSGNTPAPASVLHIVARLGVSGTQFGPALNEAFANLNDAWLDDAARVRISVLLQLVTVAEIAQATGLTAPQVIDTLDLQPYLDAVDQGSAESSATRSPGG